jgi:hypothetical protein
MRKRAIYPSCIPKRQVDFVQVKVEEEEEEEEEQHDEQEEEELRVLGTWRE